MGNNNMDLTNNEIFKFYWLNRRSQKRSYNWHAFNAMLKEYPLARPVL